MKNIQTRTNAYKTYPYSHASVIGGCGGGGGGEIQELTNELTKKLTKELTNELTNDITENDEQPCILLSCRSQISKKHVFYCVFAHKNTSE